MDADRALIASVSEEGRITLNLAEVLRRAIDEQRQGGRQQEEAPLEDRRRPRDEDFYDAPSFDRRQRPRVEEDAEPLSSEESDERDEQDVLNDPALYQAILNDPNAHVQFIYRNRLYRLKPIGTIAPIPKRIYESENGALYYWKTRNDNAERLPEAMWKKVYLKQYQRQQCLAGLSERAMGLAGYVDVDGECVNQPRGGRMHAARPPRRR